MPDTFTDRRRRAVFCPYAFRIVRGVGRVQVIRRHDAAFEEIAEFETAQVDRDVDRLVEIPVDAEKRKALATLGQYGSADDIGKPFAIACRESPAGSGACRGPFPAPTSGMLERMEDRLPPRPPSRLGHDEPDDVDELRHARSLYPVAPVDKGQEGGAEHQGVLHAADDDISRLRAGEATSVVLLTATALDRQLPRLPSRWRFRNPCSRSGRCIRRRRVPASITAYRLGARQRRSAAVNPATCLVGSGCAAG